MKNIGIRLYVNEKPTNKILATASISICGKFRVYGIKVIQGQNGPFVAVPRIKVQDEKRGLIDKNLISFDNREYEAFFKEEIMKGYKTALLSPEKNFISDCEETDLDFDVGIRLSASPDNKRADVSLKFLGYLYAEGIEVRHWAAEDRHFVCFPSFKKYDGTPMELIAPVGYEYREKIKMGILESFRLKNEEMNNISMK